MLRALILDYDHEAVGRFGAMFRSAGYEVRSAGTFREGLSLMSQRDFAVVLSAPDLPDGHVLEMLRAVRVQGLQVPFLVVTTCPAVTKALASARVARTGWVDDAISRAEFLELVSRTVRAPQSLHDQVELALAFIESRFHEPDLSVRSVARDVGLSHEYLCRLLKRHTKRTFLTHLHERRLRRAERLLTDTDLRVKEVADLAGFSTTSQLDRWFRRRYGCSPTDYRRGRGGGGPAMPGAARQPPVGPARRANPHGVYDGDGSSSGGWR